MISSRSGAGRTRRIGESVCDGVIRIGAGVQAVRTTHVAFPEVDNVPATLSRRLLTGVLRGELGASGVVASDAPGSAAIDATVGSAPGVGLAFAAGADPLSRPEAPGNQQTCRGA
jgi:beta-glucosidase-like glycosyl hydrolase